MRQPTRSSATPPPSLQLRGLHLRRARLRLRQIQFGKFDTLAGPVHSNDTLLICSTTFLGTVTTSNSTSPIYQTPGGRCGAPVFKNPDLSPNPSGAVVYEKPLTIPPTNANMRSETYTDIPADVPNPGSSTRARRRSVPGRRHDERGLAVHQGHRDQPTQTTATTGAAVDAKCGKPSPLQSTAGATVPVLDLNLVYVQAVPSDGTVNVGRRQRRLPG